MLQLRTAPQLLEMIMAERLTPTEKLQAIRKDVSQLKELLGYIVTYDDDTTADLLTDAESTAISILRVIYDELRERDYQRS